ncbi:hypothetical protein [Endozoicomonas lisbonensis]|uniref:Uncharacterized protein n=2 Tax=Endozoicomonas lisbonensis TaxID=3120522 RepID=A0ABV2SJH8_9GAMM
MSFLPFVRLILITLFVGSLATSTCAGLPDALYQWTLRTHNDTHNEVILASGSYKEHFEATLPFFEDTKKQFVFIRNTEVRINRSAYWHDGQEAYHHRENMACTFFNFSNAESLIRYTYRHMAARDLGELIFDLWCFSSSKRSSKERSGPWYDIWGRRSISCFNHFHNRLRDEFELINLAHTPAGSSDAVEILPETVVLRLSLGEPEAQQWLMSHIRELESGPATTKAWYKPPHGGCPCSPRCCSLNKINAEYKQSIPLKVIRGSGSQSRSVLTWQERIVVSGFYEQPTPVEITLERVPGEQAAYRVHIISTRGSDSGPNFYICLIVRPWRQASNYLIVSHADIHEGDYHFQFVHEDFRSRLPAAASQQNGGSLLNSDLNDLIRAHFNPSGSAGF